MSNEEFENYIALVSRLLQLRGKQQEQISVELRDHLQTRAAELESEGQTKQAALRQAIEEFGDAAAMAKNFQSVQNLKRQRWMMRFSTFAIAGVFLAVLFTMSMWPEEARFGAPESSLAKQVVDDPFSDSGKSPKGPPMMSGSAKRDAATEKALESLCSLEYEETQFSDVKAELEEHYRLNIVLDQSAMDDSLTEEELVTVRLRGISLAKALDLMLRPFNATYTIDEGVVVIISKDNMFDPEHLRLKMFDCKKLVAALPARGRQGFPIVPNGGGGGGVFCIEDAVKKETGGKAPPSAKTPKPTSPPSSENTLLNLVQTMIEPDSWSRDSQGGEGRAEVINGILIVHQTESVLRQISEMLKDLRGKVLGETAEIVNVPKKRKRPIKQQEAVKAPTDDPFGGVDPFKSTDGSKVSAE